VSSDHGWIGVDFDGTLAVYESWDLHGDTPGAPIAPMVDRVKVWLASGADVRIFTARVSGEAQRAHQETIIRAWSREHIGRELPIVFAKDYSMLVLYDDRAVQVEKNTGRILGVEGLA
jgi:hypothetical protein